MIGSKTRTILKASLTNFAASHSRLFSITIYTGVALVVSAAIGFALYPEQHTAFALRTKDGWEEG